MKQVWCVRYGSETCATANGRKPRDNAVNVPTLCDHFIVLHGGGEKGIPTCEECRAIFADAARRGDSGE